MAISSEQHPQQAPTKVNGEIVASTVVEGNGRRPVQPHTPLANLASGWTSSCKGTPILDRQPQWGECPADFKPPKRDGSHHMHHSDSSHSMREMAVVAQAVTNTTTALQQTKDQKRLIVEGTVPSPNRYSSVNSSQNSTPLRPASTLSQLSLALCQHLSETVVARKPSSPLGCGPRGGTSSNGDSLLPESSIMQLRSPAGPDLPSSFVQHQQQRRQRCDSGVSTSSLSNQGGACGVSVSPTSSACIMPPPRMTVGRSTPMVSLLGGQQHGSSMSNNNSYSNVAGGKNRSRSPIGHSECFRLASSVMPVEGVAHSAPYLSSCNSDPDAQEPLDLSPSPPMVLYTLLPFRELTPLDPTERQPLGSHSSKHRTGRPAATAALRDDGGDKAHRKNVYKATRVCNPLPGVASPTSPHDALQHIPVLLLAQHGFNGSSGHLDGSEFLTKRTFRRCSPLTGRGPGSSSRIRHGLRIPSEITSDARATPRERGPPAPTLHSRVPPTPIQKD